MCGIVGIVGGDAEQRGHELSEMSLRVAHRGPNANGVWLGPGAGLAHRRLSIVDLSDAGNQPMESDCGRYVIVFNGEVYNYSELRRELVSLGDRFRTNTDTEVVLIALRRWGTAAFSRFNGMWALVLWDKEKRALLASRDRFGKKPLYYIEHQHRIYFASEIKALLGVPGFVSAPDPSAIGDFCAERVSDHGAGTFFRGVAQLPPAHIMTWSSTEGLRLSRYWDLEVAAPGSYQRADTDEIRTLLESAIGFRLRADTPIGSMLSGGLDSSAVTCLVQKLASGDDRRHVFSTIHDVTYEEAKGIDEVRREYPQIQLHTDSPDAETFFSDFQSVLWHQEQPFADASMVAHFSLMRLARKVGVPVLLSGQGADEIFVGYPDHAWAYLGSRLRQGRPLEFFDLLRTASKRGPLPWRKLIYNAVPTGAGSWLRKVSRRQTLDWLPQDYRQISDVVSYRGRANMDPLDAALIHSIEVSTLPGFLHYEDRNSMAFGIETRSPFLDYRLVELLFRLSPDEKVANSITKPLLRSAVKDVVPKSITQKLSKQGYPAPLDVWLRARPDIIYCAMSMDCPLVEMRTWRQHAEAFLGGSQTHLDQTWRGLVLMNWYEMFFGRNSFA